MRYFIKNQSGTDNKGEDVYAVYVTYKLKKILFSSWLADFHYENDAKEYVEKNKPNNQIKSNQIQTSK